MNDNLILTDSPINIQTIEIIDKIIEQKGGNENSNKFFDILINSYHIKDIKLYLDKLINYKCCYPGIIHFPSYLINKIIYVLMDNLTLNSQFFYLNINNFNIDLNIFKKSIEPYITSINKKYKFDLFNLNYKDMIKISNKRKSELSKIKFNCNKIINDEYIFINYFKSLNKIKDNILIHTNINCLADYYVFDNFKNNNLSFDELFILYQSIKQNNNINIIYPFEIDNYYLDSFIICINKPPLDCHFSFIKKDNNDFKLLDGYKHNILLSNEKFIIDEREIIKENMIIDNLTYKVVFVSYMKK